MTPLIRWPSKVLATSCSRPNTTKNGDEMERCGWAGVDETYRKYHDQEWGVPEYDSRALWEKLILDGFQAGLSWITILKKRDAFREAFANFSPEVIATWGPLEVNVLLQNSGIIRHSGKIEATIGNAKAYLRLSKEIPFSDRMWAYVGGTPLVGGYESLGQVPTQSPLSLQISIDLKKAGFKFCGPTIVYAWMEACGLLNNHTLGCYRHHEVYSMAR
jgi:DNA-3-methyladenine glycosylase I